MAERKTKSNKDELLVEIAILKYNEQVRKMLKEELSPLNAHIGKLEERVESLEDRVKEVEQVIEPFSVIRKRFWLVLIAITMGVGVASTQVSTLINTITK